jgi:hypothetical protein
MRIAANQATTFIRKRFCLRRHGFDEIQFVPDVESSEGFRELVKPFMNVV